jgi:hypothetical protein
MPNTFAYLVLLGWPLVAVLLFRLLPLQRALVWTMISGHLLLPSRTEIKVPVLPGLDREIIPAVAALVLCLLMAPKMPPSNALSARLGRNVLLTLLALVVVTPALTVLNNTAPVIDGKLYLPGLRLYDVLGLVLIVLFQLIPLWLGLRYLNDREGHKAILEAIALSAVAYTLPALFEIRMSPQLHVWVYGFFPHSFAQAMRDGGFRPMVFLNHGLLLGIYFCMSIVAAIVLFREARREGRRAVPWLIAALWLTFVLVLSKSLGALALAVIFATWTMLMGRRLQVILGVVVAVVVLLYPMLRGSGLVPIDTVYAVSKSISTERASSLKFRLDNEERLLAHANEKPLTGWGSWGRNLLYDPRDGQPTTITDGVWLIYIGVYGWLGYIGRFGLLTVSILFYALSRRAASPSLITPGLIMVLSAALTDLLPNSGLLNYMWLMSGAIAGYVVWRRADDDGRVAAGDGERALPGGKGQARASWLMPDAVPARDGRTERPHGAQPITRKPTTGRRPR